MSCPGAITSGLRMSPLAATEGPRDENDAVDGRDRVDERERGRCTQRIVADDSTGAARCGYRVTLVHQRINPAFAEYDFARDLRRIEHRRWHTSNHVICC